MAYFFKTSFLFTDTNPNKIKVRKVLFVILKCYFKTLLPSCWSSNVLWETLPVSGVWEEEMGPGTDSLLWMNELQFTPPGTGLLISNNDKCAKATPWPQCCGRLTAHTSAKPDNSERRGWGEGFPKCLFLWKMWSSRNLQQQLIPRLKKILKFEWKTLGAADFHRDPSRVETL